MSYTNRCCCLLVCAAVVLLGSVLPAHSQEEHLSRQQQFARNLLEVLGKEPIERGLEGWKLSSRMPENLRAARVVKQRVEQMLDGQIGVPPRRGLAVGSLEHQLEFFADLTHAPLIIPFRFRRAGESPGARLRYVPP